MALQNMAWNWNWVFGGSDGFTTSIQVNFSPGQAMAQTALSQGSSGLGIIGISQYVTRAQPNGPDTYNNIPLAVTDGAIIYGFPPIVYDLMMTSVTATLMCGGGDDQMTGTLLVWFWG